MSRQAEKFDTKVKEKLETFRKEKNLSQAELARQIGASRQNIADWLDSGAMPAWAILNLFRAYSDAQVFFLTTVEFKENPIVAEDDTSWLSDPKRRELIEKVKRLAQTGNDGAIDALLNNVDEFQRGSDAQRALEELKKK